MILSNIPHDSVSHVFYLNYHISDPNFKNNVSTNTKMFNKSNLVECSYAAEYTQEIYHW